MEKTATILVTGADGFIGSHLVEDLVDKGHRVRAFVWYHAQGHNGWLDSLSAHVRAEIDIWPGDVRDAFQVQRAMEGVRSVYHLAALISIPYSYNAPESYVSTNIQGTLNVLQAARQLATERVLVVSSSEVYGTAQYVPIDESHPLQGQSPYSATKIAAERMAEAYYCSFDVPVTWVRPFNTYGPRQSTRAIIPSVICQLLEGRSSLHLGDLTPTRDLVYVKDTVAAMQEIVGASATIGQAINIATEQETTMQALVTQLIAAIQPGTPIVQDPARMRPAKSEVRRLLGSRQRLTEWTGWQPAFNLQQGLTETIAWFRDVDNRRLYDSHSKHI